VPSGAVEQKNGVGSLGDVAGDFIEVELHGLGVGEGQRERGSDASRRTNGAEQIGAFVALIGGLARPRSTPGPLTHAAVLLSDASFIPRVKPEGRLWNQISMGVVAGRPSR
jgi:hypothetical protein